MDGSIRPPVTSMTRVAASSEDPWAAFGSDDDDDDDVEGDDDEVEEHGVHADDAPQGRTSSQVALLLTQHFLKINPTLALHLRRVALVKQMQNDAELMGLLQKALADRGILVRVLDEGRERHEDATSDSPLAVDDNNEWFDAVVQRMDHSQTETCITRCGSLERLVPGGTILLIGDPTKDQAMIPHLLSNDPMLRKTVVFKERILWNHDNALAYLLQKRPCRIQTTACPWLGRPAAAQRSPPTTTGRGEQIPRPEAEPTDALEREYRNLEQATVPIAAHERESGRLSEQAIQTAAAALRDCGYCILPGLLYSQRHECLEWGQAALDDLHQAARILREREHVDLYHPLDSPENPATYRELSMREDCRMDVRDGPKLRMLRDRQCGAVPGSRTISFPRSNTTLPRDDEFFRGHPDMLRIVGASMNQRDDALYPGNFGRHNFSGSGPDGSWQNLLVGSVGAIVSLPGAADQALHADTAHLFEHLACLPPHYINAFTPGCCQDELVGQTALVHGSQRLDVTAKYFGTDPPEWSWKRNLVRPFLDVGDVLLFDCRLLHFGLANKSHHVERPLLYTNMVQHWFHDPKNWDNNRAIFDNEGGQ